jgi:hypothetical protein
VGSYRHRIALVLVAAGLAASLGYICYKEGRRLNIILIFSKRKITRDTLSKIRKARANYLNKYYYYISYSNQQLQI